MNFDVSALILAGGQALRMAGRDKGLQTYKSKAMAEWMIEVVTPLSVKVMISANRNVSRYKEMASTVLLDDARWQGIGPLGGIYSALDLIDSTHLLIVPCDTPRLSQEAVMKLLTCAQRAPDRIHYLESESGCQPLHAVLPVDQLKHTLPEFLNNTERYSVMAFYNAIGADPVYWERDQELVNINYREQLR